MKRLILGLFCLAYFWPGMVFGNSWNDDGDRTQINPHLQAGCNQSKTFCFKSNQALNKQQKLSANAWISHADIHDPVIVGELNSILLYPDRDLQLSVLRKLTEKPAAANIKNLQSTITSNDIQVQRMSAYVLGKINTSKSKSILLDVLSRPDNHADLRITVADILGRLSYRQATPILRKTLLSTNSELAIQSAISLAQLGNDAGLGILYESSQIDHWGEGLRENSILALEQLAGERFGYTAKYHAPVSQLQKQEALKRISAWWQAYNIENAAEGEIK